MGNLDIPKNKNNTNMSDKLRAINKKKKFVADGVFHAELHEFFCRILADYGYGGMEVRSSEARTDITVRVVTKDDTSKDFQRKHNELTSLIQKRYGFEDNHVNIKFDPIRNKGQCASAQAEMLKTKLLKGKIVFLLANLTLGLFLFRFCSLRRGLDRFGNDSKSIVLIFVVIVQQGEDVIHARRGRHGYRFRGRHTRANKCSPH